MVAAAVAAFDYRLGLRDHGHARHCGQPTDGPSAPVAWRIPVARQHDGQTHARRAQITFSSTSRTTVPITERRIEPKHPSPLEKKTNIRWRYPVPARPLSLLPLAGLRGQQRVTDASSGVGEASR